MLEGDFVVSLVMKYNRMSYFSVVYFLYSTCCKYALRCISHEFVDPTRGLCVFSLVIFVFEYEHGLNVLGIWEEV